jgi:hypothetical protein
MNPTLIASATTFLAVFLLVCLVGWKWYRSPGQVWSRFFKRWGMAPGSRKVIPQGLDLLVEERSFVPVFEAKTDLDRRQFKLQLARAGINHPLAVPTYLALRLALGGLGFLVAAGADLGLCGWSLHNVPLGLLGAIVGYHVPETVVRWLQRRRQQHLRKALPEALDLLSISIECGHGPDHAMREIVRELKQSSPTLAKELTWYFSQLDLGNNRKVALQDLALRGFHRIHGFHQHPHPIAPDGLRHRPIASGPVPSHARPAPSESRGTGEAGRRKADLSTRAIHLSRHLRGLGRPRGPHDFPRCAGAPLSCRVTEVPWCRCLVQMNWAG